MIMSSNDERLSTILLPAKKDPSYLNLWSAYKKIQALNLRASKDDPKSLHIAVIGSTTLEPLAACLDVKVRIAGFSVETYVGGFNTYRQEVLDKTSELYRAAPDVIILSIDAWSILDKLFIANYVRMSNKDRRSIQKQVISDIKSIVESLETNTSAIVLVNNFVVPVFSPFGIADNKQEIGLRQFFSELNITLIQNLQKNARSFVVDLDAVAGDFGKSRITNWNTWYRGSIPFSEHFTPVLADEYLRYILAMKGQTKKCIVLDLDNTLWGGIIGEDGIEGIKLGNTSPGIEYVEFQKILLGLYNRGVILAICSKNNYEDAMKVFREHPYQVLKEEHFAAMRINWQNKSANLEELAAEINIGLDSMVFLDDNPIERAQVSQVHPEVLVVDMPENPRLFRNMLEHLNVFDVLSLTKEDLTRGEMYAGKRKRSELEKSAISIEDFLRTLELKVRVNEVSDFDTPRVVQLIGKTNQFNMTTRRYTDAEINDFRKSKDAAVYSMAVQDRFGDEGVVAAAIIQKKNDDWLIDSFLMSCRVIGRSVETAMLAKIIEDARKAKASRIIGEFIPTKKNVPAEDFYRRHGFIASTTSRENVSSWILTLDDQTVDVPEWIELIEE
jgi:FkbH-like protein